MKKMTLILISIAFLVFLFTSCTSAISKPENVQGPNGPIWNPSEGTYQEGIILVGYHDKAKAMELVQILNGRLQRDVPQIQVFSILFDGTVEWAKEQVLQAAQEDADLVSALRFVEPSFKRELIEPINSTDEFLKSLPQPRTADLSEYLWGVPMVKAPTAWAQGYTGEGIVVAVVDTGADFTHPDLLGQNVAGYAPLTDTVLAVDQDHSQTQTHGTHVAGTIVAKNNGQGITGVAYNAKAMNIRIFEAAPTEDNPDRYVYIGDLGVAAGIAWAVDNGAHILNNSWGGKGFSNTLLDAFNYATSHGVISVVSQGNGHTNEMTHPSGYPGMINVAASTATKGITYFSSRGQWLTVAAPGENVLSTIPLWDTDYYMFELPYDFYGGTSMASPHVSGVVALLLEMVLENAAISSRNELPYTPYQIRQMIIQGAEDIMAPGFDHDSGWGLVDAAGALAVDINAIGPGADLIGKGFVFLDGEPWEDFPFDLYGAYLTIKPKGMIAPEYYGKSNMQGELVFLQLDPGIYDAYVGFFEPTYPGLSFSFTGVEILNEELEHGENFFPVEFYFVSD